MRKLLTAIGLPVLLTFPFWEVVACHAIQALGIACIHGGACAGGAGAILSQTNPDQLRQGAIMALKSGRSMITPPAHGSACNGDSDAFCDG